MMTDKCMFAEVGLPTCMEFVGALLAPTSDACSDSMRAMAFYVADDVLNHMREQSVPYWNMFLNAALAGAQDKSMLVRQYALSTLGSAAVASRAFAPMAGAAVSLIYALLQKNGEKHRRRRATSTGNKQSAMATDAAICALGKILEHHEAQLGDHVDKAWSMFIANLPLKYDTEAGKATHAQLLDFAVAKQHSAVVAPEHQVKVLSVLVDVYKTKFSSSELDAGIALAVAGLSQATIDRLISAVSEKTQKKVNKILKKGSNFSG